MTQTKRKLKSKSEPIEPGGAEEYITACPVEVQSKLAQIRTAIRAAAPGAIETLSYFQIPGYSYPGYDYQGMFAWFSFKKPYIRLHVRPPVIQKHKKELGGRTTTKSLVNFPADQAIPAALVKKLVKASVKEMKSKKKITD